MSFHLLASTYHSKRVRTGQDVHRVPGRDAGENGGRAPRGGDHAHRVAPEGEWVHAERDRLEDVAGVQVYCARPDLRRLEQEHAESAAHHAQRERRLRDEVCCLTVSYESLFDIATLEATLQNIMNRWQPGHILPSMVQAATKAAGTHL